MKKIHGWASDATWLVANWLNSPELEKSARRAGSPQELCDLVKAALAFEGHAPIVRNFLSLAMRDVDWMQLHTAFKA
jgi:hypothetical protein